MQQEITLRFASDQEDFKGTLTSFSSPADQVEVDRTFGRGTIAKMKAEPAVEVMLWLIWAAWKRETSGSLTFDEFVAQLSDYEMPDAEDENPTPETSSA